MIKHNKVILAQGLALLAMVLAFIMGGVTSEAKSKYDFEHYDGYHAGLEAAKTANKPILLDFYFDT